MDSGQFDALARFIGSKHSRRGALATLLAALAAPLASPPESDEDGEFRAPYDVAVLPNTNRVYVSDQRNDVVTGFCVVLL